MAATSDIFGIGTSALVSYQRVLATTSHNISNVQNEDYSRQRVELGATPAQRSGAGFIGSGVTSTSVNRLYDNFLTATVRDHLTEEGRLDVFHNYASQIDDLLANPDAGLMPAVESFFNAVHDVANDPTSTSTRAVLLAEGESLADRFHYMGQRIDELTQHVGREIEQVVSEINSLAHSVAELNAEIMYQTGASGGNPPNDLLDQRDAALADLAERVNVETVQLSDGSVNVFIGNGQNLVVGNNVLELAVGGNVYDQSLQEITYQGSNTPITQFLKGGTLGGLLEVRDDVLLNARSELGRIAISVAETFNQQHQQGMDINGNMGQEFFYGMAAATANTAGAQVLPDQSFNDPATGVTGEIAAFTNAQNLRASDYQLDFDGADFTLTRISDGTSWTIADPGDPGVGGSATLDFSTAPGWVDQGFEEITLNRSADPTKQWVSGGDSFLIRPTYNGSQDIKMRITNPAEIAAAAPFRIDSATDANGVPTNTGTGALTPGTMSNAAGVPMTPALPNGIGISAITLSFNDANDSFQVSPSAALAALPGGYDVLDSNGNSVLGAPLPADEFPYDPATNNGNEYTLRIPDFGDITFNISGTPDDGDAFVIRDNALNNDGTQPPGGVGDARNASLLAALQNQNTMRGVGGSTDYQGAYGNLVADVGIRTAQAEVNLTARQQLLEQARAERDEVSGVNLDEEAANLIKFQQAYQAAAQVLSVGRDVFNTLLAATGR